MVSPRWLSQEEAAALQQQASAQTRAPNSVCENDIVQLDASHVLVDSVPHYTYVENVETASNLPQGEMLLDDIDHRDDEDGYQGKDYMNDQAFYDDCVVPVEQAHEEPVVRGEAVPVMENWQPRPRSSSASSTVETFRSYSRPEFIYAKAILPTIRGKVGICFKKHSEGGVYISRLRSDSVFQNANLQEGDRVLAINNVTVTKAGARRVAELLRSKAMPLEDDNGSSSKSAVVVTICVHNKEGDPSTVSTSVQKPTRETRVGVALQKRRGALCVTRVNEDAKEGLFFGGLLTPRHRVVMINGIPCDHLRSQEGAQLISMATDRVTIISRPERESAMVLSCQTEAKWWNTVTMGLGVAMGVVKAYESVAH